MAQTYTLVLHGEMLVATVIDGGDIHKAIADQSNMQIDENAITTISGVSFTDEEPEDRSTVIWESGNSGWLLDENDDMHMFAVGLPAQRLMAMGE